MADPPKRFERLNALAAVNNASSYLEIGVSEGNTFFQVAVEVKVGVDPRFRFDSDERSDDLTRFHEITSDHFFATVASSYAPFDLIYLDGLHKFEQTFRDFCASLAFSHHGTIWLIDDTRPTSYASSLAEPAAVHRIRADTGDSDNRWHGDAFKAVLAIADFFPQFSFATFTGHGQTAVWFEPRSDFAPRWNNLETISRFDFAKYLEIADEVMNFADTTTIVDRVSAARVATSLEQDFRSRARRRVGTKLNRRFTAREAHQRGGTGK